MDFALSGYAESLEYLFARTTGSYKFGLERTLALLEAFGRPERAYPVIHIAGTNGKGSTVATAGALLRAKGLRVARYTSPHLVDFRERIVVNDGAISADEITRFVDDYTPLVERLGATFFEATTALAFKHFAEQGVDVALIETGLGGRMDSTNVVMPVVAGVTSIGFDHMEYLGPTLEAIALEKAGIFKPGTPAVIGEPEPVIRTRLAAEATVRGATPVRIVAEESSIANVQLTGAATRFTLRALGGEREIETPLIGRHQASNFAFTLALLDAAGGPFRVTLEEAARDSHAIRLPGRFQRVRNWIFDVAHNADGARTLAASIGAMEIPRPLSALVCVLGDKEWQTMLDALGTVVDHMVLTNAPTAPDSRRWHLSEVATYAAVRGYSADPIPDFDEALAVVCERGATTLVTGSFHTVGDAMFRLQVSPLTG